MNSISSWFSDLSRRKLRLAASAHVGSRDNLSLHRIVLLKNSLTQAELTSSPPEYPHLAEPSSSPNVNNASILGTSVSMLLNSDSPSSRDDAEEKWLDSVLETLADDFDDIEAKVSPTEADVTFLDSDLESSLHSWVSPYEELDSDDPLPFAFPSDIFLNASVLPSMQSNPSLHAFFHPHNTPPPSYDPSSPVEIRYPEADYDLPLSDASSEAESEDEDDGPATPYGGSQASLRARTVFEPEVYGDSYFLHGSEIDLFAPPSYLPQC